MNNVKNISIRETHLSEYAEITDISIRVWKQAYRGLIEDEVLDTLSAKQRLEGRIKWFSEPNKFSIVALHKNKIIGFADFGISRHLEYGKGEIYAIYVLSEYQRCGAGKLLMRHAMHQLGKKDLIPYLVIALENNMPAKIFYESIGFQATGNILSCIGQQDYKETVYVRSL